MIKSVIPKLRETWFFWVFCFCFGFVAGRLPGGARMPWQTMAAFSLVFALLIAVWVIADAKRRQRTLSYGFSALTFLIWPVFAPLYLFQTRGIRAFLSLFGFAICYYICAAIGVLVGRI
jgi:hypothetical protein